MPTYKIAHIRKQGQDIIIVPLETRFHNVPAAEKASFQRALQRCAIQHGLKGPVCLVWEHGRRFYYINLSQPWKTFCKTLAMAYVFRNINKKMTCS